MTLPLLRGAARAMAVVLLACASAAAFATPAMDMRADDLLPMAPEFKKSLNLSPNQQTLWLQVETRSKTLMRERHARRERLQQDISTALAGAKVELRDMAGAIEAESATSAFEEMQMRQWWLGVNDALDERQRQQVATLFAEQLTRVPDSDRQRTAPREREDGASPRRSSGRGKSGAGMGSTGS